MPNDDLDSKLDHLIEKLPTHMRKDWCVIPRRFLLQVFLLGVLLGGSLALGVVGHLLEIESLKWSYPIVVVSLLIATKLVPWWRGDRFEEQLAANGSESDEPQSGA